jgi:uncharacterized DUF497 family protein
VNGIRFEWDEAKNLANQRKHGISFEEAIQIFADPLHFSIPERVVDGELRWRTFGTAANRALLVVAHTLHEEHEEGTLEIVRIISAREVTREERRSYEEENG